MTNVNLCAFSIIRHVTVCDRSVRALSTPTSYLATEVLWSDTELYTSKKTYGISVVSELPKNGSYITVSCAVYKFALKLNLYRTFQKHSASL